MKESNESIPLWLSSYPTVRCKLQIAKDANVLLFIPHLSKYFFRMYATVSGRRKRILTKFAVVSSLRAGVRLNGNIYKLQRSVSLEIVGCLAEVACRASSLAIGPVT